MYVYIYTYITSHCMMYNDAFCAIYQLNEQSFYGRSLKVFCETDVLSVQAIFVVSKVRSVN